MTHYIIMRYTNDVNAFNEAHPVAIKHTKKSALKEVKDMNKKYAYGVELDDYEFVDTTDAEYNYYDIEEI